jgi:ABC-2 type transport system ATP-binding protein
MSPEYAVELRDIDKIFHTRHFFTRDEDDGRRRLYHKKTVHAVDHVALGVKPGEVFGLLGRNGAGKTTTVKMMSGLIKPDSGEVFVDGLEVESNRLKILRRIGVVLEGTRTCIWPLTPLENLAYFGNLRDVRGSVLRQRSIELLDFIGLKEKMNVQVRRLSRGQKQKLAICIALITDPQVILLDEPTTGLDVQSSRSIKDKVTEMAKQQGKCAVVTTHDMSVAQELCTRIAIIDQGKLVTCKPTEELLDLFEEQRYEYRLDRSPDAAPLERIAGVNTVSPLDRSGDTGLLVSYTPDEAARSTAIYETMKELSNQGVMLKSVTQLQQTLENVFLQLTTDKEGAKA